MITETTYDKQAVLLLAQGGNRAAFGELVPTYQKRAYGIAYGFVGNREDALELAQEAFVRGYKAMGRFDMRLSFYPWMYRIVKNTCLNHLKKRRRRGEISLDGLMASGYEPVSNGRGPEGHAALDEMRGAIGEALVRLTEDHREIITLRHLHELSYSEIAGCLDIPEGTVMSRLHAARKSLRKALTGTRCVEQDKRVGNEV